MSNDDLSDVISALEAAISVSRRARPPLKSKSHPRTPLSHDDDDDDDQETDQSTDALTLALQRVSVLRLPITNASPRECDALVQLLASQLPARPSTAAGVCANFLLKQRPLTLSAAALNAAAAALLGLVLAAPRDSTEQLDAFRALAALLLERGASVAPRLQATIISALLAAVDDAKRPAPEFLRMTFNSLGNLCVNAGSAVAAPLYATLTSALATHLDAAVRGFFAGKRTAARSLCAVLRAWTLVLPECGKAFERFFSDLCARLRELVFLRPSSTTLLVGAAAAVAVTGAESPDEGAAAPLPAERAHRGSLAPVSPLLHVPPVPVPQSVSSGSESSSSAEADVRKRAVKVQLAALTCLQQLARVSPHAFFGVVLSRGMLPLSSLDALPPLIAAMASRHSTLLSLAACADTPQAVALGCVATVSACLDGARQLLQTLAPATSLSERQQRNAAFTPLSNVALQTVVQLHAELVAALNGVEPLASRMLVALLQCSTLLVVNTPYAQLEAHVDRVPLAHCCVRLLRGLLAASDAVHAELAVALALLAACVSVAPRSDAIAQAVFEAPSGGGEALFDVLLAFGARQAPAVAEQTVVAELLSALAGCAMRYTERVLPHWTRVQTLSRQWIASSGGDAAALAGLRALETCAHALARHAQESGESALAAVRGAHARFIVQCIADDSLATRSGGVRAALCSCLTAIGPHGFGALERFEQVHCLSVLLGASSDAGAAVRAAALRALGVFVLFPDLRSDTAFVLDVAHALIQAMNDDQLSVRMRAAWSIANVCDTLVTTASMSIDSAFGAAAAAPPIDANTFADDDEGGGGGGDLAAYRDGDEHDSLLADLPHQTLVELARTALKASTDHERVRPNAVRALGHFARFAPLDVLLGDAGDGPLVAAIIGALVARLGAGSAKVRWNASYALGSSLRNAALRRHLLAEPALADAAWFAPRLFGALTTACSTSPNFKVRINSALAISAGPHRVLYGSAPFGAALHALSLLMFRPAAAASDEPKDASTAVYARRLAEQLERTLLHLLALADAQRDAELGVWAEFKSDYVALLDRTLNEQAMAARRRELRARKAGQAESVPASEADAVALAKRAVQGLTECAAKLLSEEDRAKLTT